MIASTCTGPQIIRVHIPLHTHHACRRGSVYGTCAIIGQQQHAWEALYHIDLMHAKRMRVIMMPANKSTFLPACVESHCPPCCCLACCVYTDLSSSSSCPSSRSEHSVGSASQAAQASRAGWACKTFGCVLAAAVATRHSACGSMQDYGWRQMRACRLWRI